MTNQEIASILQDIGELLEVKGEVVFKTRAYLKAAQAIQSWPEALDRTASLGKLESIPGVGKAIAEKVKTLLATGSLPFYENLLGEFPAGMLSLLDVPGVGPKSAYRFSKELGIGSPEELEAAAKAGKLRVLSGMGEKREEAILRSLEQFRRKDTRRPLVNVLPFVRDIMRTLQEIGSAQRLTPAGSVRRFEETIGDVDIIGTSDEPDAFMDAFVALPVVQEVKGHGSTKSSVVTVNGLQVDVRLVPERNYGNLLQHFTGSKNHNIKLREYAQRIGLSVSEWGVTNVASGVVHNCVTEEDVYAVLKLPYFPPEVRQGLDEIDRALRGPLPPLIELTDVKGDLHAHTNWSDGNASLETMAQAAESLGWQYLAICDHSAGRAVAEACPPNGCATRSSSFVPTGLLEKGSGSSQGSKWTSGPTACLTVRMNCWSNSISSLRRSIPRWDRMKRPRRLAWFARWRTPTSIRSAISRRESSASDQKWRSTLAR